MSTNLGAPAAQGDARHSWRGGVVAISRRWRVVYVTWCIELVSLVAR